MVFYGVQIFQTSELLQWTKSYNPFSLPHSGLQPLKQNQKSAEVENSSAFNNLSVKEIKAF